MCKKSGNLMIVHIVIKHESAVIIHESVAAKCIKLFIKTGVLPVL